MSKNLESRIENLEEQLGVEKPSYLIRCREVLRVCKELEEGRELTDEEWNEWYSTTGYKMCKDRKPPCFSISTLSRHELDEDPKFPTKPTKTTKTTNCADEETIIKELEAIEQNKSRAKN